MEGAGIPGELEEGLFVRGHAVKNPFLKKRGDQFCPIRTRTAFSISDPG